MIETGLNSISGISLHVITLHVSDTLEDVDIQTRNTDKHMELLVKQNYFRIEKESTTNCLVDLISVPYDHLPIVKE